MGRTAFQDGGPMDDLAPGMGNGRPRIGLALGAGVARGWAHVGVIRELSRMGIKPDVVAGCSVGALVGGVHLAGKLDELEDWVRGLTRRKLVGYLDLRLRRSGGLIGGERLVAEMRRHLGDACIEALGAPYAAIAT